MLARHSSPAGQRVVPRIGSHAAPDPTARAAATSGWHAPTVWLSAAGTQRSPSPQRVTVRSQRSPTLGARSSQVPTGSKRLQRSPSAQLRGAARRQRPPRCPLVLHRPSSGRRGRGRRSRSLRAQRPRVAGAAGRGDPNTPVLVADEPIGAAHRARAVAPGRSARRPAGAGEGAAARHDAGLPVGAEVASEVARTAGGGSDAAREVEGRGVQARERRVAHARPSGGLPALADARGPVGPTGARRAAEGREDAALRAEALRGVAAASCRRGHGDAAAAVEAAHPFVARGEAPRHPEPATVPRRRQTPRSAPAVGSTHDDSASQRNSRPAASQGPPSGDTASSR